MRHFLSNVMAMCRVGPESDAYKVCIADLADVFFKPMSGEVRSCYVINACSS